MYGSVCLPVYAEMIIFGSLHEHAHIFWFYQSHVEDYLQKTLHLQRKLSHYC